MERIALFIDYDNTCREKRIDFQAIKNYLSNKGIFIFGRTYFKFDSERTKGFLYKLWEWNIQPIYSPVFGKEEINNNSKSLADPMIIIDIMETLLKNDNITTIALMSGDKDFVPVIRKIMEYGKKVILIYPPNAAEILTNTCSPKSDAEEKHITSIGYDEIETMSHQTLIE